MKKHERRRWFLNGRSNDSRRCIGMVSIGVISDVHCPFQRPSPLSCPCLCSRSVPQSLHHLTCWFKEKRWDTRRMPDIRWDTNVHIRMYCSIPHENFKLGFDMENRSY
ncbi:hypothetical protein SCA6_018721 [Theobroma cacao]